MSKLILDSSLIKRSILFITVILIGLQSQATINVVTPLPANITLCKGDGLTLSISATSDSTLEYVWKKNGVGIGSNSPVFSISSVNISDTGTYTCDIKELNTSNIVTQSCVVAINLPPHIISHPTGGISPLCEGGSINLTADVQNATMVWKRGGTVLSTGVNSYSKTNVTLDDSGEYYVYARALTGCRDTNTTKFHQFIRKHGVITTQPVGANLRDQANMSYVMRVIVSGDGPFAFQWKKDGVDISGANSDSFKIPQYTTAGDSGSYRVIINTTAPCNDTLTSSLVLVGSTLCPIIISQPDTLVYGCLGGSISLEVKAVGVSRYQWFKNGTDSIPYASYPRYTVVNLDSNLANYYTCVTYRDTSAPNTCDEKLYKRTHVVVKPRQSITTQPIPNPSCHAATHTMFVSSANATSYQWYKNNVAIVGATDSTYTVNPVTATPDAYKVHVMNPYCTPEPSETVLVRQINPSTMAAIYDVDKLNLKEQCTDSMGWTYFANDLNLQEMLFAIRKDTNKVHFRPEIKMTKGFIKELIPNQIENKGILLGLRMFNILIDSGEKITTPYDVKFYFDNGPREAGQFLAQINSRANTVPGFASDLPLNDLSFIVSVNNAMDTGLLNRQSVTPLTFNNQLIVDKSFGYDNNIRYVRINKLVSAIGGGTFYFHYTRKGSVGIQSAASQGVEIYPNPTNGHVHIQLGEMSSNETQISLTDFLGRVIQTNVLSKNTTSKALDYSHIPAGNYIIKLDNGTQQVHSKLTIVK